MKKILVFISLISVLLTSCSSNNAMVNNDKNILEGAITYRSQAPGYNGMIMVDVTLDKHKNIIKDVKIVEEKETPGIGGPLKNKKAEVLTNGGVSPITLVPKMIVENQSINVDAVSGATVTSYGILHAVSGALIDANYRVDAVTAATEIVTDDYKTEKVDLSAEEKQLLDKWLIKANYKTVHEDMSSDVVIIGGGGAGLASAISASENGANVIVIEKNAEVGGDTLVCGAIYNASERKLQEKLQMMNEEKMQVIENALNEKAVNDEHKALQDKVRNELEEFKTLNNSLDGGAGVFDSENWFSLQTYNGGDKKANLMLVKTLCYNAYECLNWIKDIGVEFYDFISQGAGSLWERTHTNKSPMGTGFISNYLERISKDDRIKILTNTTAVKIEKDENGRVNTVFCRDKYGNEFNIKANRSVIIATGGFSANDTLLNQYNKTTDSKWKDIDLGNLPTTNRKTVSTGDGIDLGLSVGADVVDMSEIQLLYLGNLQNGELTKYPPRCVNGTDQVIFINKNGERFTNEGGRRDEICKDILEEPDKMFYILESADGDKYVDIYSSEFKSADGFTLDYLVDNDYVYVGNTLEELAQKLNINVEVLEKTISEFNECVDGKEDKFGRTLYSTKIEKGPYIATKRQVSVHHTMGGLKIDEDAQVLDTNGNKIEGLYAAGEVTGGIHGGNRLGGNAVVDTVVFGRIAGRNAALDTLDALDYNQ